MSMSVPCPSCGRVYVLDADYCQRNAGKIATCNCGQRFPVPAYAGSAESPQLNGVWRDGPLLVMAPGAVLPSRCYKCGARIGRLNKRVMLRLRADYFGPGRVGQVLSTLTAHEVAVRYGRCGKHSGRIDRRTLGWLSIAAAFVGTPIAVLAMHGKTAGLIVCGVATALSLFGVVLICSTGLFELQQWRDNRVWVSGFSEAYLALLPPLEMEAEISAAKLHAMSDTNKSAG